LVRPIPEYSAACLDPCTEGQINAIYRVQNIAAPFTLHTKDCDWKTVAQRWMIARICALLNAYSGERTWRTRRELAKALLFE